MKPVFKSILSAAAIAWSKVIPKRTLKLSTPLFLSVMQEFKEKEFAENRRTDSTREKWDFMIANITEFFTIKRWQDLRVDEIRIRHMEDLKLHLHQNLKSCGKSHSARHLQLCKRVMKYAVLKDYIKYSPIESMECKRDKSKPVVSLERSELQRFMVSQFTNDIYIKVVHLYVFQATTGLSYEGLYNFVIAELPDQDGNYITWIQGRRRKNQRPYFVPLFPEAERILMIYGGNLPRISNATYNKMLREVSAALNIDKYLTTHTARKTFATLRRQENWPIPCISDMLGHESTRTTENYYFADGRETVENEYRRRKQNGLVTA